MAHLPSFPEPSEQRSDVGQSVGRRANDSRFSFAELKRLLGQHGAGSASEDLALDLMLHEIASEARSATRAAGSAIALWQAGEFVCRAAAGEHTPELGSRLSTDSGLSAACIQSRAVQRCDDTEVDPRVDAIACRRLGVRSVLVVPMVREHTVVGILEVFSPHARAFTDDDAQTLLVVSRRMLDRMTDPAGKQPTVGPGGLLESQEGSQVAPLPARDPWVPVLTVLIIGLALMLGWMIGHRGWQSVIQAGTSPVAKQPERRPVQSETPAPAELPMQTGTSATPVSEQPKSPRVSSGGLVIYEKGKLIFQEKPRPSATRLEAVEVSSRTAESLILDRVEPQYPRQARLARIQGPVVLEVHVSEKGTVDDVEAISGDPELVRAAAEAVQQWHFKPYAPRGEPVRFRTQVTVDFKLP